MRQARGGLSAAAVATLGSRRLRDQGENSPPALPPPANLGAEGGFRSRATRLQRRRGRPRRPVLAALARESRQAAHSSAAGAQGQRRARLQRAACRVLVVGAQGGGSKRQ